jgi:hypothetical protein
VYFELFPEHNKTILFIRDLNLIGTIYRVRISGSQVDFYSFFVGVLTGLTIPVALRVFRSRISSGLKPEKSPRELAEEARFMASMSGHTGGKPKPEKKSKGAPGVATSLDEIDVTSLSDEEARLLKHLMDD